MEFLFIYPKISISKIPNLKAKSQTVFNQPHSNDVYLYQLTIIFSTIHIWAVLFFGESHLGSAKLLPFLFIPFALFFLGLLKFKSSKATYLKQLLILLPLVILSGFLLASISKVHELNHYLFVALSAPIALVSPTQYRLVIIYV